MVEGNTLDFGPVIFHNQEGVKYIIVENDSSYNLIYNDKGILQKVYKGLAHMGKIEQVESSKTYPLNINFERTVAAFFEQVDSLNFNTPQLITSQGRSKNLLKAGS
ncbi:hypothetical protein COS31_04095 [Candidatus Roizmanbacteria bacterium CG02_land_8_20_14_3_00_36_15]|uniref:Uncharacterized protein n=2 Tax=Candidatus Roizmaniibacteriota TaxID=1752723 RepID=A0A2M8KKQ6_9BACT|nr:MAG: hypothetical protein COS51_04195 [Candidatus Roizmanbacteria bacterium CG03_land_8_20_14_0_80_36_21]PIV37587.1 MAG: hypothetical protein COS31_04095 [Candidatus Roizmanbacteria bacterium CG02_land_8_20_14_3_00_36_15]PIY69700.1 MAG: hypothetical protein COY89_05115 [Candidatus Roizmanbacteria bacterium CG_4_10_14_0_8_um_filter_36_36]PJA52379.1 MAG: hypothetical protein CO166_06085 [Candidatus Roizmanbacteria bacterium CG_4_9_14_3_um_filter_36_11]PJC81907.1 MAG: hypothetical protein CO007